MIRIYRSDGRVEDVDAPLVAITSTDGLPAVFLVQGERGEVVIARAGDPDFERICGRLGVEPAGFFRQ